MRYLVDCVSTFIKRELSIIAIDAEHSKVGIGYVSYYEKRNGKIVKVEESIKWVVVDSSVFRYKRNRSVLHHSCIGGDYISERFYREAYITKDIQKEILSNYAE